MSGIVYPASSYIALIIDWAPKSSLLVAWLNCISERIRILVGILPSGTLLIFAWFRIRLNTASKLVDIPQSALLSCISLSDRDPVRYWSCGLFEKVMKASLKLPSFLSEMYIPKDIATSIQDRLGFPPTSQPIDPDTSTTGRILSTEPSIQLGNDSHCFSETTLSPPIFIDLMMSYGYTAPALTFAVPSCKDFLYSSYLSLSLRLNVFWYLDAARDGSFEYSIDSQSPAHILDSTTLVSSTNIFLYCLGDVLNNLRSLLATVPFLGIHFAQRPSPFDRAVLISENISSSNSVPTRTKTSSHLPNSGISPMFFLTVCGELVARKEITSLKTFLSPAPSLTSLTQNRTFDATKGFSLYASLKSFTTDSFDLPLIDPMEKNKSTHLLSEVGFVTIPLSVKVTFWFSTVSIWELFIIVF